MSRLTFVTHLFTVCDTVCGTVVTQFVTQFVNHAGPVGIMFFCVSFYFGERITAHRDTVCDTVEAIPL